MCRKFTNNKNALVTLLSNAQLSIKPSKFHAILSATKSFMRNRNSLRVRGTKRVSGTLFNRDPLRPFITS